MKKTHRKKRTNKERTKLRFAVVGEEVLLVSVSGKFGIG